MLCTRLSAFVVISTSEKQEGVPTQESRSTRRPADWPISREQQWRSMPGHVGTTSKCWTQRARETGERGTVHQDGPAWSENEQARMKAGTLWLNAIKKLKKPPLQRRQEEKSTRAPSTATGPRAHAPAQPPSHSTPRRRRPTPNIRTRQTSHATRDQDPTGRT